MSKLTQERLKELLHYDPATGIFTRRINRGNTKKGDIVGSPDSDGYLITRISGVSYLTHRLTFLYMEGYFPENIVDHIDRNKVNNRWKNLREVSNSCNMRNVGNFGHNTSGVKGVVWCKKRNKWKVRISTNSKRYHLGYFRNFDEAVCHRLAAEQCIGWDGCESSSPAFIYVQKMLNTQSP